MEMYLLLEGVGVGIGVIGGGGCGAEYGCVDGVGRVAYGETRGRVFARKGVRGGDCGGAYSSDVGFVVGCVCYDVQRAHAQGTVLKLQLSGRVTHCH